MGGSRACGFGGAGAGWEPRGPAEAGRQLRGAERSLAGDLEGGSRSRRRGRRPPALRAARFSGPSGLRDLEYDAVWCLPEAPRDREGESLAPQRG